MLLLKDFTQKSIICNRYFLFVGDLLVEFAFFFGWTRGDFDRDSDEEITFLIPGDVLDSVSFELENFSMLRP